MIVSSQRFLNDDIVNEKIAAMENLESITLQAYETGCYDENGEELFILFDGHHTYEAAKLLEIPVDFEIVSHPEYVTGMQLFEIEWIDSDWYDIATGERVMFD